MKRFTKMMKKNRKVIIFLVFYIITLMFALMFIKGDTTIYIAGFTIISGLIPVVIKFFKYQKNKLK